MRHSFLRALKRDFKRALGVERYKVGWVKTGPKSRVGRFAETEMETTCEQCGSSGRYFILVTDHIPYPWVWTHDALVCHNCLLENCGTTSVTQHHPKDAFESSGGNMTDVLEAHDE
jgi:hypothetical protein